MRRLGEILRNKNTRRAVGIVGLLVGLEAFVIKDTIDPPPIHYTPEKQAEILREYVKDTDGLRLRRLVLTTGSIVGNTVEVTVTEGPDPENKACSDTFTVHTDPIEKLFSTRDGGQTHEESFVIVEEIEDELHC